MADALAQFVENYGTEWEDKIPLTMPADLETASILLEALTAVQCARADRKESK